MVGSSKNECMQAPMMTTEDPTQSRRVVGLIFGLTTFLKVDLQRKWENNNVMVRKMLKMIER